MFNASRCAPPSTNYCQRMVYLMVYIAYEELLLSAQEKAELISPLAYASITC